MWNWNYCKGQYFWLSRRDLQIESGNWAAIFDKCDPSIRFWQCERFVRNNLTKRKIRSCRLASEQFLEFKKKMIGLDANKYSFDEQDIISALQVAFKGEIMHTQYCVQNKRLVFFFSEHKLGVEIDEYGHADRFWIRTN